MGRDKHLNPFKKGNDELTKSNLTKKEQNWGTKKFTPKLEKAENHNPTMNAWQRYKTQMIAQSQSMESQSDAAEMQQMHKNRDITYRRFAMQQKRKEATTWDSEDAVIQQNAGTTKHKTNKQHISDLSSLSSTEANIFRKTITKATKLARGSTLQGAVDAMKKRQELKLHKTNKKNINFKSKKRLNTF